MPMDDQTRQEILATLTAARIGFLTRTRAIIQQATLDAESFALAIGEVSPDEAYAAWAQRIRESL